MAHEIYDDLISQGIALMSSEKYEQALETFKKAREEEPRSLPAYIHLGNAYVNMEKYEEGIAEFKKALILEPSNGVILYSIGSAYLLMGDRLKTVEYYNKAEAAGFRNPDIYQLLALTFFESNDSAQALRNINRAIALAPLDGQLRLFKANVYLADGKFEEALQTLDEMNKYLPDAYESYSLRADIYCGMKRFDEALAVSQQGCERFPEDANVTAVKLKVLTSAGRFDEALKLVEEMKENGQYEKVRKLAVLQEATAYVGTGKQEEAVSALDEAYSSLGDDEDLLFVELSVCATLKQYNKVLALADRLLKVAGKESYIPTAQYYRAVAMETLGMKEEAMAEYRRLASAFRKVTIADPSRYEVYIFRLLCHTKLKEFDKALALSDYLESVNPESSDAHAFRYYIYKEKGDTDLAAVEKEKVKQIDPEMIL